MQNHPFYVVNLTQQRLLNREIFGKCTAADYCPSVQLAFMITQLDGWTECKSVIRIYRVGQKLRPAHILACILAYNAKCCSCIKNAGVIMKLLWSTLHNVQTSRAVHLWTSQNNQFSLPFSPLFSAAATDDEDKLEKIHERRKCHGAWR